MAMARKSGSIWIVARRSDQSGIRVQLDPSETLRPELVTSSRVMCLPYIKFCLLMTCLDIRSEISPCLTNTSN